MSPRWTKQAEHAAEIWRAATNAIALTGAGISVPSGIPDFRSPGGIWSKHDPDEVATINALHTNPKRVWEFVVDLVRTLSAAQPNAAHKALATLEKSGQLTGIITQNIDSLHQEAGSSNVIEFHGSGKRYYCLSCHKSYPPARIPDLTPQELPWRCSACNNTIRPDFVFFGESIPQEALYKSMALATQADLVIIIGTSGEVAPANTIPHEVKARGGKVIEINLGPSTYVGISDVVINASCHEVLPVIAAHLA